MTFAINYDGRLIVKIPSLHWCASYEVGDIPVEVAVMIAYLADR